MHIARLVITAGHYYFYCGLPSIDIFPESLLEPIIDTKIPTTPGKQQTQ